MNCPILREREPLTIVLAYHQGDHEQAKKLLCWIAAIGGCHHNPCLLVADFGVDPAVATKMKELASSSFASVSTAFNMKPVPGWIPGSNSLFMSAMGWCYDHKVPWLWLEPDTVPLVSNWQAMVEEEYYRGGRPFMAQIYAGEGPNKGKTFTSGIGVYPAHALNVLGPPVTRNPNTAFDVTASGVIVRQTHNSQTIHHFWGESNLPPTFVPAANPERRNALTLDFIRPGAVLFHRCKDGSLIDLLTAKLSPNPMMVVFPFCNKDAQMAAKNMEWICQLNPSYPFDILLSYEIGTYQQAVKDIERMARGAFRTVRLFEYPGPQPGQWPPSVAFRALAFHMELYGRPWLWMEFDAIPLQPQWLEVLQSAYLASGKAFAGPVVHALGHMNGTAIYPADTPKRIPYALNALHTAWDTEAKGEQCDHVKDLNGIYQHVWGVNNGHFHPFIGGPPSFPRNSPLLQDLDPKAVIFHRCKDGTLIDRLRERLPK